MNQSTAPAFALALKNQLANRYANNSSLSSVRVDLVPSGDQSLHDAIIIIAGRVSGEQSYASMGIRYDEARLPGSIYAYSTGRDTDQTFQTAWVRAGLILDELAQELAHNPPPVGIGTEETHLEEISYTPLVAEQGGWVVRCDYTITYRARIA